MVVFRQHSYQANHAQNNYNGDVVMDSSGNSMNVAPLTDTYV